MTATFDREVLANTPLAQAVSQVFAWALGKSKLENVYEKHRGRSYQRVASFTNIAQLLFRCLTEPYENAWEGLHKAKELGEFPCSIRAFYYKLGNVPVDVSLGVFRHVVGRLREIMQRSSPECPTSLRNMTCLIMDGKVIKRICRRLKDHRANASSASNACTFLGSRSLVVAERWSNTFYDLVVNIDGEANEVEYTEALLDQIRTTCTNDFLIIGDRAFGVFKVCEETLARQGHFLFRKPESTVFVEDPSVPSTESTDRFGRTVQQWFGWIGSGEDDSQEQIPVRQISVERGDTESLVLITSLTDPQAYPVGDLLDAHLDRWNVENLFQQITETFHLRQLISTRPQGMLFQLVMTLLMYNTIQIIKQVLAETSQATAPKDSNNDTTSRQSKTNNQRSPQARKPNPAS